MVNAPQTQGSAPPTTDIARVAGRGGLAITGAKVWFILAGFVQQTMLPRLIGLDGYGGYSVVQAIANIPNNVVTTASIQGVSRAVASASAEGPDGADCAHREVLRIHAVLAPFVALPFVLLAPAIANFAHAAAMVQPLRVFGWTLLVYAFYTPLVGALNGRRRFVAQAALDVTFATLRTLGMLLGAYWLGKAFGGVMGAALGVAMAATAILPFALRTAGFGRRHAHLSRRPTFRRHFALLAPLALGQLALNVLMQADLSLLSRFAHESGWRAGLATETLESGTYRLVGAYRAAQLFAFLPAQLLLSISFVLFPMIARAHAENDREKVGELVRGGFRLAAVLVGAMVACVVGVGPHLLRLAFPAEAAELAGTAVRILALGQGTYAIFALQSTVLVSVGRERASAGLTAAAAGLVIALCWWFVPNRVFGPQLLLATAAATSTALLLATTAGALLLRSSTGAFLAPSVLVRCLGALGCAALVGTRLPWLGKIAVLPEAAVVFLVYVVVMVCTGALTRADLGLVKRVIGRKRGS